MASLMMATGATRALAAPASRPMLSTRYVIGGGPGMVVECSSRPQKKATAHHMKTRPKKTQPWDIRRKGPTKYAPLPPLPPDWTLADDSQEPQQEEANEVAASAAPALS